MPDSSVEDTDMKQAPTPSETDNADGDRYYWGDLVTLRLLLGACALMWTLGLIRIFLR
jgi:hypothetical protein